MSIAKDADKTVNKLEFAAISYELAQAAKDALVRTPK